MHAGNEGAVLAQPVDDRAAHARHEAHVDRDIGRIGDLDADLRDRRADRPHRERHHVHRAPAHAAVEQPVQGGAHLAAGRPSYWSGRRRPFLAADERAIFHARHVGRMRAREIAIGAQLLVQADERTARRRAPRRAGHIRPASRRTRRCVPALPGLRSPPPIAAGRDGAPRTARSIGRRGRREHSSRVTPEAKRPSAGWAGRRRLLVRDDFSTAPGRRFRWSAQPMYGKSVAKQMLICRCRTA